MNLFFKLLNLYIKSSIHIALATFSFVQITYLTLKIEVDSSLNYFIFFATIVGYNFLKYFEVFCKKTFLIKKHFGVIAITIIALFLMIWSFFQLKTNLQLEFIKIGLVVFFYPFLRKYGILKIVLVSFCFAFITVYIPSLGLKWLTTNYYILLFQRFIIVLALMIPFEISDSKTDDELLKTLPQLFGIQKTKYFGFLLLMLFLSFSFINFQPDKFIIDFTIAIVIELFIGFSSIKKNQYYTSFWVESIPIFWLVLYYILRYFQDNRF